MIDEHHIKKNKEKLYLNLEERQLHVTMVIAGAQFDSCN